MDHLTSFYTRTSSQLFVYDGAWKLFNQAEALFVQKMASLYEATRDPYEREAYERGLQALINNKLTKKIMGGKDNE